MTITVICEFVVGSREFLEALRGDAGEIPSELSVLRQNHSASSDKTVDQRLLPHLCLCLYTGEQQNPNPEEIRQKGERGRR